VLYVYGFNEILAEFIMPLGEQQISARLPGF